MTIFNGYQFAMEKEQEIALRVAELKREGKQPSIAAILFREDVGSQLYTRLKKEAAERVGMTYQVFDFSLTDPTEQVVSKIQELNNDPTVTGIIIQKPWRHTYENISSLRGEHQDDHGSHDKRSYNKSSLQSKERHQQEQLTQKQKDNTVSTLLNPYHLSLITYHDWWNLLTSTLNEHKDVDGLHPNTIEAIKRGTWEQEHRVLPATCKAVLMILQSSLQNPEPKTNFVLRSFSEGGIPTLHTPRSTFHISIIGKSDLLGKPLYYELKRQGWQQVELLGKKELQAKIESGEALKNAKIIVTATGQNNLITDQLITDNCILIDAGEPRGDVDFESVKEKADFITPVPGGVGPVTIVSLLENCLELVSNK